MSLYNVNFVTKFLQNNIKKRYVRILDNRTISCLHRCPLPSKIVYVNQEKMGKHYTNCSFFITRMKSVFHAHENVTEASTEFRQRLPEDILAKVKYNSILSSQTNLSWSQKVFMKKRKVHEEQERRRNLRDIPFSLNYLRDKVGEENEKSDSTSNETSFPFSEISENNNFDLPYSSKTFKFYSDRRIDDTVNSNNSKIVWETKDWMENYEVYDGEKISNEFRTDTNFHLNSGTPDKSIPISKIPCGGCGAHLHCRDTGLPGYLPSELFRNCSLAELRALKCQRCHFLEKYNIALHLSVAPEDYTKLLSRIRDEVALALVLVDLTDFPCSLWPNIIDIIGTRRPVIVVGNKVDLLPRDSPQFLSYVHVWFEKALKESPLATANVKDIALISAETGFGIESLITKLQNLWQYRGNVYLLGCTNVGKSTLFNTLLRSDYCKLQASDVVIRATTSLWPGTTLNLLKFPILRPEGHRLYHRILRLQELQRRKRKEEELLREKLRKEANPRLATFIGPVETTFKDLSVASRSQDPFSVSQTESGGHVQLPGLDPSRKEFSYSKWCFDTPGTIHPDQILDILTAQELAFLLRREMILPRTFQLYVGDTLLIAGLGRVDFEGGSEKCRFTVFAADALPITVCRTIDTEMVYASLASSNLLRVPSFEPERLAQWPGLEPNSDTIKISGCNEWESAADVVLSSAGWISVTPKEGETCILRAWTPFAKGIHVRQPALMRFSVKLRGKIIRKSPAYTLGRAVKF